MHLRRVVPLPHDPPDPLHSCLVVDMFFRLFFLMTGNTRPRCIAIYSLKGGVGKTTLSVNLAWASAMLSSRRTLLWDLDPQGGASWLMNVETGSRDGARAVFSREIEAQRLICSTAYPQLDLLAADPSLRGLDRLFFDLGKRRRLQRLIEGLGGRYDRVVLDCPPGLTETSEQVLRAADIVVVPVVPSPLAERALHEVVDYFARSGQRHPPLLPVLSMVDLRRRQHRAAMEEHPDWPVITYSSLVEQMAVRRAPLAVFAGRSTQSEQIALLWRGIEKRLGSL